MPADAVPVVDDGDTLRALTRYRQLFDRASDGVWAADDGGTITYVNDRLAGMLGYAPEEMIGRAFAAFVDRGVSGPGELRCSCGRSRP
jgi:PAS domain S-box-containing protein